MKANGKDGSIVLHEAVWEDDKCLVQLLVSRRRIWRGLSSPKINPIKCSKSRMSCYKSLMKRALCAADMRKSLRKSHGALVECHRLWQLVRSLDASQFAVRLSTATCQPVSSSSFMIGGAAAGLLVIALIAAASLPHHFVTCSLTSHMEACYHHPASSDGLFT